MSRETHYLWESCDVGEVSYIVNDQGSGSIFTYNLHNNMCYGTRL